MERKITVRVYEIDDRWGKPYVNERTRIELYQTVSVEDIHSAMKLLGFSSMPYKIQEGDGWSNDKVLYENPKLTEIDNAQKLARENHLKAMQKKADEFNELPEMVQEWTFSEGYSIKMIRSVAKFNPSYSTSSIGGGVSVDLYKNGEKVDRNFWLSRYISEDGKVLRKAFMSDMQWEIKSEVVRTEMALKLKEIYQARKDFSQKWSLGR